jgi:putative heme-binding domain-containing protein
VLWRDATDTGIGSGIVGITNDAAAGGAWSLVSGQITAPAGTAYGILRLQRVGGGSGTGACWIDEPWMPAAWNDSAFTCDWGRGEVYRHAVEARGAGYEAGQQSFLKIPRSTDLDVDATGNIYAASWRGGSFSWAGPDIGFIARVRARGLAPAAVPDFPAMTVDELVACLAGPSHRLRLESQRALLARPFPVAATAAVETLAASRTARLSSRVAAAFALALGRRDDAVPFLQRLTGDPSIAPWAVRALGDLAAEGVAIPREPLVAMLRSDDPRTRREAVVAIARTADASMIRVMLPSAADADPIVAHTAVEAAVRMSRSDEATAIVACCGLLDAAATSPAIHRAAARVLGEIHSDAAAEAVLARLSKASSPSHRADLAWAAARLWRREAIWKGDSWGTRPDTRGPYYALEEWSASPTLVDGLVAIVRTTPPADLPTIVRAGGLHRLPAAAIVPALAAREDSDASLAAFLDLSGDVPAIDVLDRLAAAAAAAATPDADRLAAVRVLARSPDPRSIPLLVEAVLAVEEHAASQTGAAAREAARASAAASLDVRPLPETAARGTRHRMLADDMLMTVAGSSAAKSAARGDAASRLVEAWRSGVDRQSELVAASVRTGSRVLANELVIASEGPADRPTTAAAKEAVRALRIDPSKVREVAADTGPKVGERKTDELLNVIDERRGDRSVGAELFVARKCVACHAAGVDGAGLGPSLANAAGIYNRKQLAESVLLPNKSIAQGFATTAIVLDDGRAIVGFVTSEADDSLTLRDAQGVPHSVAKRSIEDRRKLATSAMPEGLVADLTVSQFASLLDYVESLGAVKPPAP